MTDDEEQRLLLQVRETGKWLGLGAVVGIVFARYAGDGILALFGWLVEGPGQQAFSLLWRLAGLILGLLGIPDA